MGRQGVSKQNKREWYIGIDFGTSNSCILAYDASTDALYSQVLADRIGDQETFNIPTLITCEISNDGKEKVFYIGCEVKRHPLLRPYKGLKYAAREMMPNNGTFGQKAMEYPYEQSGLNSTLEFGHDDYTVTERVRTLLIEFFKGILRIGDDSFDEKLKTLDNENKEIPFNMVAKTIKSIVIGKPVDNTTEDGSECNYDKVLKDTIASCFSKGGEDNGFKKLIQVKPEPELAGVAYMYGDEDRKAKTVLVVDMGGGTTDFSVLSYNSDGEVDPQNIGSCEYAGNAINDLIYDLLSLVSKDTRSKQICAEAKENLFGKIVNNFVKPKTQEGLGGASANIGNTGCMLRYKSPSSGDKGNIICLEDGYIYRDGKRLKLKDGHIDKPYPNPISTVFKKIGNALETSLSKNQDKCKKINTVFFVGGTSIITPLKEYIQELFKFELKKYSSSDLEFKDTFDEEKSKLKLDKTERSLDLTCYNSIAAGAVIKAMKGKVILSPRIEYQLASDPYNYINGRIVFVAKENAKEMIFARQRFEGDSSFYKCFCSDDWNDKVRIQIIVDKYKSFIDYIPVGELKKCGKLKDDTNYSLIFCYEGESLKAYLIDEGKKFATHMKDIVRSTGNTIYEIKLSSQ